MTTSRGTHTDVAFGANEYATNRIPRPTRDIAASTAFDRIVEIGNTSRGTYILFMTSRLPTMLVEPLETAAEKNDQGTSATYEKSGYGTPPVAIFTACWAKSVSTTMKTSGGMMAHANPRKA